MDASKGFTSFEETSFERYNCYFGQSVFIKKCWIRGLGGGDGRLKQLSIDHVPHVLFYLHCFKLTVLLSVSLKGRLLHLPGLVRCTEFFLSDFSALVLGNE